MIGIIILDLITVSYDSRVISRFRSIPEGINVAADSELCRIPRVSTTPPVTYNMDDNHEGKDYFKQPNKGMTSWI